MCKHTAVAGLRWNDYPQTNSRRLLTAYPRRVLLAPKSTSNKLQDCILFLAAIFSQYRTAQSRFLLRAQSWEHAGTSHHGITAVWALIQEEAESFRFPSSFKSKHRKRHAHIFAVLLLQHQMASSPDTSWDTVCVNATLSWPTRLSAVTLINMPTRDVGIQTLSFQIFLGPFQSVLQ